MSATRILGKCVAFAAVATLALAGCSSSGDGSDTQTVSQDTQCFTQLSPDQKAQLTQYASQNGSSVTNTSNNTDGTQNICVLEPNGQGGYNERFYNRDSHFGDYLLYGMLFGRSSHALTTYGVVSGDISVLDAIMLNSLMDVNSGGQLYRPYTHSGNSWQPRKTVVNNTTINHVYYGSKDAGTFKQATQAAPPAGFTRNTVLTSSSKLNPALKSKSNTYSNSGSNSNSNQKANSNSYKSKSYSNSGSGGSFKGLSSRKR